MKKLIPALLLTFFFLYLTMRDVNFTELKDNLLASNPFWLLLVLVTFYFNILFKALRWNLLVKSYSKLTIYESSLINMASMFAITLIPFRIGELFRPYIMKIRHDDNPFTVFMSCVLERVFDGLVPCLFIYITFVFGNVVITKIPGTDFDISLIGYISITFFGGLFTLFFLMAIFQSRVSRISVKLFKIFPEKLNILFTRILNDLLEGLKKMNHIGDIALILFYSLIYWGNIALYSFFCLKAMNIEITWIASLLVVSLVALGNTIPVAPGFIGTFQFFSKLSLLAFGVSVNKAVAFSILYHAIQIVPIIIGGFVSLGFLSMKFENLKQMARMKIN